MPTADEQYDEDSGKWLSPDEKLRLIRELKERLKEIERLKRELGMAVQATIENKAQSHAAASTEKKLPDDNSSHPVSAGRVAEEVEELHVPALEMLDDKPLIKKKKQENAL